MCALADELGTFRASLLSPMSVLNLNFMLRSMLILSRSCCVDLRAARCLRAYCTMFDDRLAPILLKKPAAADGRSAISLRAAGSDPPALTPSTQLRRCAKHKA
jgi:hypothetical protein